MPSSTPILSSFNAGELSPLLEGRTDFDKYDKGCRVMENMIPTVHGPAYNRPGTQFIGYVKETGGNAYLIPFIANSGASFILEFGNGYVRFWHNRESVRLYADGAWAPGSGGVGAAELAMPWNLAQLVRAEGTVTIQTAQSNDVMWIVHPSFFPIKLRRVDVYKFESGLMGDGTNPSAPFKDQNIDQDITVWSTAERVGQAAVLTASAPIFNGYAGTHFYLGQAAADIVKPWEIQKNRNVGDRTRSDGRNYIALNTAVTGNVRLTHSFGAKFDGVTGVQWEYTDDGAGVVYINSIAGGGTIANCTVIKRLPGSVVGVSAAASHPSHRWAYQAWNEIDGYPTAVSFYKGRLCFARGQTLWASVVEDYENFLDTEAGLVTPDLAVTATIGADKNDRILWLINSGSLLAGTASTEYAISEISPADPFGPGNVQALPQSAYGSRALQPIKYGEAVLFVQRGGQRLRECMFDIQGNAFKSNDLSVLAQHLTYGDRGVTGQSGLLGIAFQAEPDAILWCARGDGVLIGFTYSREQQVLAWHRHPLGGQLVGTEGSINYGRVLSVACVPSPEGALDDLYLTVQRSIGGVWQTFIEVLGPHVSLASTNIWYYHDLPETSESAFLDACVFQTVDTTGIVSVTHLGGEEVASVAAGMVIPAAVAASGLHNVGTNHTGQRDCAGLPYRSILQTMRLNPQSGDGTSQGKLSTPQQVTVRVKDTVNFLYGPELGILDREEFRLTGAPMDEATPLFTGDRRVTWQGGMDEGSRLTIVQDQPLPLTLVALIPHHHVSDAG